MTSVGEFASGCLWVFVAVGVLGMSVSIGYRAKANLTKAYQLRSLGHPPDETSAEQDELTIYEGTATPTGQTLTAPFTDTECIGYFCRVLYKDPEDPKDKYTLDRRTEQVPFTIESRSGQVKVEPDQDTIEYETETIYEFHPRSEIPEPIEQFVAVTPSVEFPSGSPFPLPYPIDWWLDDNQFFLEGRIEPRDTVTVWERPDETQQAASDTNRTVHRTIYNVPAESLANSFIKKGVTFGLVACTTLALAIGGMVGAVITFGLS